MIIGKMLVKKVYKKRSGWSHKGDFGRLLVIGGSKLYTGSPAFNVLSAYRAGCDLVTLAAPERAADIAASFSPDIIAYPLKGEFISRNHLKQIFGLIENNDAVVLGCGLMREKDVLKAVEKILEKIIKNSVPAVIDADALYAVKGKLRKNTVLTPHSHEFFVLSRQKPVLLKDRIEKAKALAAKLSCVVLLKGHVDVISDGERIETNETGNPYMTKGGMGDTLAGICGALLARGAKPFDAACCAAYLNGLAGDLAAKKYGEGVMASDLVSFIPKAIAISLR